MNKESYRVRPPSSHMIEKVSEAGLGEVEPAPFPDLLREADRGRFAAAPASIPAKGWRDGRLRGRLISKPPQQDEPN